MLWYKGWLETRIKLYVSLGIVCLILIGLHKMTTLPHTVKVSTLRGLMSGWNAMVLANSCVWLAGAGIMTQPAFQQVKGIHGSTLFTLSLPVSRFRLLTVRASLGWLLMAGSVAVFCLGLWFVSPQMRSLIVPIELVEQIGTLIGCGSAFYFLSVLLATFLEDTWRVMASFLAYAAMAGVAMTVNLPRYADVFYATGKGSPLLAHSVPWGSIGFSTGVSVVLFLASLKIVRMREY